MAKNADPNEDRGVWVDEVKCIGCQNCIYTACATFRMEANYGRARVFAQWLDTEDDIQLAIDTCPVNCIHYVHRDDLAYFEYVTQRKYKDHRNNVGLMQAGMGSSVDLFNAAHDFMKDNEAMREHLVRKREYSPHMTELRKGAIRVILETQFGWLGQMVSSFMEQIMPDEDVYWDGTDVGERRRAKRSKSAVALLQEQAQHVAENVADAVMPIPAERALVPIRVYEQTGWYSQLTKEAAHL